MSTNRQEPKKAKEIKKHPGQPVESAGKFKKLVFRRRWEPEFSIDWTQLGKPKSN